MQSPVAITASTPLIAALFSPLRRGIQEHINQRIFRHKYNVNQILTNFSATLREEFELEQMTNALVDTVNETIQPKRVSLWLRQSEELVGTMGRAQGGKQL